MASITADQDRQITYISGVTANGIADQTSFWTWNFDSPATYDSSTGYNYTAKFGDRTAGTGATISFHFDDSSNWTSTERAAFVSTAKLWSAVANVKFVEADAGSALISITRGTEGFAAAGFNLRDTADTGTNQLGIAAEGGIEIDTSVDGFGPLGSGFSNYGGYPYTTLIHEWGHVLGLGHGGPYDEGLETDRTPYSAFDSLAWSIMSYNDQRVSGNFSWGVGEGSNGFVYGAAPTTFMPLDILAIQRLYGKAIDTPLSGGQTYGFNQNIGGDIGKFYDFTLNNKPVVTIWNAGTGNTLDLSGFTLPSTVDLHDGSFSSTNGLTNNLAIAYDTRIDTVITGFGNDRITANDNGNVVMAGGGADLVQGGASHDHLYGAGSRAINGDGVDTINGGGGNDYIQGNAGEDRLDGGVGSDRIQGGQGNDEIVGGAGNDSINGNLGDDRIDGGANNDSLRGGQGNDRLTGGTGNDTLLGDLGADTLVGGGDADRFVFATGSSRYSADGLFDTIADFTDGADRIALGFGIPSRVIQIAAANSLGEAVTQVQQVLTDASTVAAVKVGGDSYLFYGGSGGNPLEAIKLAGYTDPMAISIADFG